MNTDLAATMRQVAEHWDSGSRRAYFAARFADEQFEVCLDRVGKAYCLGTTRDAEALDVLVVIFTDERKQLVQHFDWHMLSQHLNHRRADIIIEQMCKAWDARSIKPA